MLPVIGLLCSSEDMELPGFGRLRHHAVFERYVEGLVSIVDAVPMLIPAMGELPAERAAAIVSRLDGVVLPGAATDVAPELYGAEPAPEASGQRDRARDGTALPLIRAALGSGVPLLGICRGMQELNVACGGTLLQAVHGRAGRRDHRSRRELPLARRYGPAHPLRLVAGGWIDRELASRGVDRDALLVSSLHGQAVERPGRSVVVEGWADDGTVEAIRVEGAPALAIGVQWHIEWHTETPLHAALLDAFGRACGARSAARSGMERGA